MAFLSLPGKGAIVDKPNFTTGRNALMEAAAKGRLEIVQALVNAGAEINMKDSSGKTALDWAHWARLKGRVDVTTALVVSGERAREGAACFTLSGR
jgi:ankyrin repeat protein